MHSATIIIPTLNEEENIDPLLERLSKVTVNNCCLDILFVDDNSTDKTVEKINAWRNSSNNISVLEREGKPDLTQSILEGVTIAQSDFILVMDADLSHPIDKIPELLQPILLDSYDVAVGSRYTKDGGITDWPLHRRFLSWFGGLPARVLTDVKDTTSGFFACKKECFSNIDKNARGYKILLELLASGLDKFRATEIPIVFTDRTLGQSKLSGKQLIQYFQRLLELCGGKMTTSITSRFIAVGLMGVVIDAIFFQFFLTRGWSISNAHISSFFIAATFNYFLNSAWSFQYSHDSLKSWLSKALKYIYFGIIALTVRGGVLAMLISLFEVPPSLAIFPAIIAASLINYFGASFIVFPSDNNRNQQHSSINWRVLALATTAFMLLLRFLYLGTAELIPDEAYYWNYKEHLSIGYLDHPPLIAWLIWLGTSIFGDTEFGVRIFSFSCGILTLFFTYRITEVLFDRTSAYISLFLTSTLPFTVATGFLATTDSLQITLWVACLYFMAKIMTTNSAKYWIGVGICVGLGMLSKYTIALLVIGIIIFICINRPARFWWKHPMLYISGIVAIIIFLPTLYWNFQNEWSSFSFQTTRRLDRPNSFSTHYIFLHTLILLSPLGLILLASAFKNLRVLLTKNLKDNSVKVTYTQFILVFTFIPLSVYIYYSLSHYPRFHWTAPIWLVSIPIMSYILSPSSGFITSKLPIKLTLYSTGFACLIYGGLLHFATLGLPISLSTSITDHYFWKQVATEIHKVEEKITLETGQKPLIVGLSKWSVASALRFYDVDKQVDNISSRNAIGRSAAMYETWIDLKDWQGHPVIFVALNPNDLHSSELKQYTNTLNPIKDINIYNNNNKLRNLSYRTANNYNP